MTHTANELSVLDNNVRERHVLLEDINPVLTLAAKMSIAQVQQHRSRDRGT